MPINIGSNIASLGAQRQLNKTSTEISSVFERLSSGLRINRASDDAAGLAISATLNSDRRVFTQGIRNFNDGISLLNIADSAVEQLSGIVTRLKELSTQSANGILGKTQREAIDNEAQALSKEYLRIVKTTEFNNLKILNGDSGDIRLQGGYGINGSINSNIGGAIGTGEFSSATFIALSSFAGVEELALSDLNGDGIEDAVVVGGATSGQLGILLGQSNGTFAIASTQDIGGGNSKSVAVGDINGDGIMDLAYTLEGTLMAPTPWVTVRIGNGDGTFQAETTYSTQESVTEQVQLKDLNYDGILDLFTMGSNFSGAGANLRLGTGSGTFGASISINIGSTSSVTEFGDINNDGKLDLVSIGADEINVMLGQSGGSFSTPTSYQISSFFGKSMSIADINGDGNLDLLAAYEEAISSEAYTAVYIGTGDGTFNESASYRMGDFSLPTSFGDINGDGNIDIAYSGIDQSINDVVNVRFGNGQGGFGEIITSTHAYSGAFADVKLVDRNQDGVLDTVAIGQAIGSQGIFIRTANTQSGVSALLNFSLKTQAEAKQALPLFDQKLNQLAAQKGSIGAFQARLSIGVSNLQSAADNYALAISRITDIDTAEESARLVRLKILQEAAGSILAQANQQPALAMKLLNTREKMGDA